MKTIKNSWLDRPIRRQRPTWRGLITLGLILLIVVPTTTTLVGKYLLDQWYPTLLEHRVNPQPSFPRYEFKSNWKN